MSNLVKWDPFQDMSRFFEEVDKLFASFLKSFSDELYACQLGGDKMRLQVKDEGKELVITGDIPQALKDNVDVFLRENSVLVTGETTLQKDEDGNKSYHWSKFSRACSLPARVNSKEAKIDFQNGKIIIRVPKE